LQPRGYRDGIRYPQDECSARHETRDHLPDQGRERVRAEIAGIYDTYPARRRSAADRPGAQ
jgi:hypothetical protein